MQLRRVQGVVAAAALLLAACGTRQVAREAYEPRVAPTNVASDLVLPAEVRRVIMLPIYYGPDGQDPFVLELDRMYLGEFTRTGAFEVVPVSRERLSALFGFQQVESVDLLPADFLDKLRNTYDADAVALTDLTVNQQFRPISLGIRCKLVDLRSGRVFWAIDTVFDSADPAVAQTARDFAGRATYSPYPFDASGSILQSPRKFADFVVWSVFRTLPPRG